jgi:hypothetical protein
MPQYIFQSTYIMNSYCKPGSKRQQLLFKVAVIMIILTTTYF